MEDLIKRIKEKFGELGSSKNGTLRKLIFLLLTGICLLVILWPLDDSDDDDLLSSGISESEDSGDDENDESLINDDTAYEEYVSLLESKLKSILENVKGVGNVDVMITLKDNGEKIVEKDVSDSISQSEDSSQSSSSEETVTENSDGETSPYVSKALYPEISGVVVSCEGGADSEIAIKITEAVQALFDIPAHKIVVLEQK